MTTATIDRIEEGIAVLIPDRDGTQRIQIPVSLLPPGSKEGDIVTIAIEGNPGETAAARERTASLIDRLKRK
jgi:hypothetical protein